MARILLADDDGAMRDLVRRALETEGHGVTVVADGTEAMEHLQSGALFEALVTDVQMPGVDGIALARSFLTATGTGRVLVMSGYSEQLERARSLDQARVATLLKPASLDSVRAGVRGLLSG